jgi:hypothetical protein
MQLRIHRYKIMRIRVRSASQVGKLLTNILLAVTISTRSPSIPFCFSYRMRSIRLQKLIFTRFCAVFRLPSALAIC